MNDLLQRCRRLFQPAEGWGLYTEQIDGHTIVPDYIKSEEEADPQQVVPSVGDIPELPPHQETGDHQVRIDDAMDKVWGQLSHVDLYLITILERPITGNKF